MANRPFLITPQIVKADESLGLVFGYGIVCTDGGEPYFDTQGDHIPPESMLKAATDFMANSRATDDMHDNVQKGVVVHSFPMTNEIAKAYGMTIEREGWMIAAAPGPEIVAKFISGEYTGFSIGGERILDEPPSEEAA